VSCDSIGSLAGPSEGVLHVPGSEEPFEGILPVPAPKDNIHASATIDDEKEGVRRLAYLMVEATIAWTVEGCFQQDGKHTEY
jgi:hypothetical protein